MQFVALAQPVHHHRGGPVVHRAADLEVHVQLVDDPDDVRIRHRNRPPGDVTDHVRTHGGHDVEGGHSTGARPGHPAGVHLHRHPPRVRPLDVAPRLPGGQQVPVVEDELELGDPLLLHPVEVFLGHPRNQQDRADHGLHPGRAHSAGGVPGGDGQAQHDLRGQLVEGQARYVQFAGRDHRRGAAVQVVVEPTDRVLRRGELAEGRVHVAVDQARHHRHPAGRQHPVRAAGLHPDSGDHPVLDQQGGVTYRRLTEPSGGQLADLVDEQFHLPGSLRTMIGFCIHCTESEWKRSPGTRSTANIAIQRR